MTTKLYRAEIPVVLMVEADSRDEARQIMAKLWGEVAGVLPEGASTDHASNRTKHLRDGVKLI